MSCFRLRTYEIAPPGGYVFPKPGGGFWSSPMIEALAGQLAAWRAANGQPRASARESLEDADHYTCQRLGNMRQFCIDCSDNQTAVALGLSSPLIAPPCRSCGAPVNV